MSSFSGVGGGVGGWGSGREGCRSLRQTHRVGVEEIRSNLTLLLLSDPLLELLLAKSKRAKETPDELHMSQPPRAQSTVQRGRGSLRGGRQKIPTHSTGNIGFPSDIPRLRSFLTIPTASPSSEPPPPSARLQQSTPS